MIFFPSVKTIPHTILIPFFALFLILLFSGCTTIQNRRDLYFPNKVEGPYTRMLHHGISAPTPTPVQLPKGSGNGKNVVKPRG
jgi:hypothetical protein